MASQSPSEFLTFYRRAAASRFLRTNAVSTYRPRSRAFSNSISRSSGSPHVISDKGTHQDTSPGKKQHVLDKGKDDTNVQTEASHAGRACKEQDTGGNATRQKDESNSMSKAKKEFSNAPDVAIGMQDERGGNWG